MSEIKKIASFSWLIRRAEAMLRKDPEEYNRLRGGDSVKLLPGCRVQMHLQDNHSETMFVIKSPDGSTYATVRGMQYKGVFYTKYKFEITPTKYRKRMHKYLPITLPEGARCNEDTPCIYHNLDGSAAKTGEWHGDRPRRSGKPDLGRVLCFVDADGTLVTGETAPSDLFFAAASMDDAATPIDLLHGFLPGSCHSKIAWYDSMECPEVEHYETVYRNVGRSVQMERVQSVPGPLWDTKKMKLLAARAHSSALAFVKKFPHMSIALYPMAPVKELPMGSTIFQRGPLFFDRFGSETRDSVVVGRTVEDDPIVYYLPQLVVWWHDPVGNKYPHQYHAECHHFRGLRFVKITVPPVGCASLSRGPGNFSVRSNYYRPGPKDNGYSFDRTLRDGKAMQERAFHGLLCFSTRSPHKHVHQYRIYNSVDTWSMADAQFHDWEADQNKVMVEEMIEAESSWQDSMTVDSYACSPSQVFSHMEEKELLDSLPMC